MRLYLMQHGKPQLEEAKSDRVLSDQGRRDVGKTAEFLKRVGVNVKKIFHSGKTRARETAEIVAAALGPQVSVEGRNDLSPLEDARKVAEGISTSSEDLLIAGHLPHLAKLAALLVVDDEAVPVVRFQQGGVVCLEKDDLGKWAIAWMVVPELL